MTHFVCKCLNIIMKCETSHAEMIEFGKLGFASTEQRDPFFREPLASFTKADVQFAQEVLVDRQPVKGAESGVFYRCLNCKVQTHAAFLLGNEYRYLIRNSCMVSPQTLSGLLKSDNYSPVFKILVEATEKLVSDKLSPGLPEKTQTTVGCLSRQLTKSLRSQLELVEEEIRVFRDKRYAEFECFREKAHRDHKILTSIATNKSEPKEEVLSWLPTEMSMDLSPPGSSLAMLPQPRNRLSSLKINQNPRQIKKVANFVIGAKEDSLDSEGIFDLEGMDFETPPHNGAISDMYFSDSEDSVSRDEGIHVARDKKGRKYKRYVPVRSNLAKSLPMNMPNFHKRLEVAHDDFDDEDDPTDIAKSIKALARSVHGGDIFGELPRPRFSTLI